MSILTYTSTHKEYNDKVTIIDTIELKPKDQELRYSVTLHDDNGATFTESTNWLDYKIAGQRIEIQQKFPAPAKFAGGIVELNFVKDLESGENTEISMDKWKQAGEVKLKGMSTTYLRERQVPVLKLQK